MAKVTVYKKSKFATFPTRKSLFAISFQLFRSAAEVLFYHS